MENFSQNALYNLQQADYFEPDDPAEPTARQRELLAYIARHPGIASSDVAAAYSVNQATMVTRLQRLVRLGLIRREYDRGPGGKVARWTAI